MKKFGILIIISILLIPTIVIQPQVIYSNESQDEQVNEQVKLYSNEGDIGLYEDITGDKLITRVSNNIFVTLLDEQSNENEKYALVRYIDEENKEEENDLEGYVKREYITPVENGDLTEIELELDTDEIEGKTSQADSEQKNATLNVHEHNEQSPKEESLQTDDYTPQLEVAKTKATVNETNTSRLGHIRNSNVRIYESIGGKSKVAGSSFTNAVYYIKRQASVGNQTYYLISKNASATTGVVGWVKSNDMSIHNHVGVDKRSKTFYLNGKGKTTTKAWGGSKDTVHVNLSSYRGYEFKVHLTEKVGKNTWYRGNFEGKTVWVHSSYVDTKRPEISIQESKTSKLGHVRSGNVRIYDSIGGSSKSASSYTNAVYYIKRQASVGNQTYYLISKNASATTGVVGWVKSNDMSIHNHVGVDKKSKTFYLNGKGKMTTKAWGGSKDTVYTNLSAYKGQAFKVHLTEKVGKNTWYRGNFKGKTVWVHSSYVDSKRPENAIKESKTSKLGHIRSGNARIYDSIGGSSKSASSYTNAVYYIKRQASVGNQTYYLISKNASATTGVVGWVKSNDMSIHNHVGVDKKSKTFHLNGKGKMTTKAWGGSKDTVYTNLSAYKGQAFKVHLTEKVGNNTWYRGNFEGKTVWVHSSYVTAPNVTKIFLDPGHGGSDPGASGNNLKEKDLTLDIAKRIERYLKQYQGVEVKMSRTNDTFYELEERVKMANDWNADYFVSTHINSFTQESANGFESFIHNGKNGTPEAKKKQEIIHEHIAKNIDEVDRGPKAANFKVLRETNMPAILFEYMFITNKKNSNQLKKSAYREKLARVTAEGIAKAYNLEKK